MRIKPVTFDEKPSSAGMLNQPGSMADTIVFFSYQILNATFLAYGENNDVIQPIIVRF